jgi:hypothetical protein
LVSPFPPLPPVEDLLSFPSPRPSSGAHTISATPHLRLMGNLRRELSMQVPHCKAVMAWRVARNFATAAWGGAKIDTSVCDLSETDRQWTCPIRGECLPD